MNFILNNPDFREIVTRARESARGRQGGEEERGPERRETPVPGQPRIQPVRDYRPRERTVYDEQGRPIT